MQKIQIKYNPYTVNTEIYINDELNNETSELAYVNDKRLQEWIEPRDNSWPGIFKALRNSCGDEAITLEFTGTIGDFEDLKYAKEKFGKDCFSRIELIHVNKDTARNIAPYKKMEELKKLYNELQNSIVDELKTPEIRENFESAINSDFRIVIVAPMSSGKSTLINAMLGHDLLPAVNQATTAVITEIRDNDAMDKFIVNAISEDGEIIVKDEPASKELITSLNDMKSSEEADAQKAYVKKISIEGDIPNIPSDALNTVLIDTPGGNNSLNQDHKILMDEAIEDENKSLILYVFNGTSASTNDSQDILDKISDVMQTSSNGKQSRDRFLFVANKMDAFDPANEPFEQFIQRTIKDQFVKCNITEPRLFLTCAQAAKLIRMKQANEPLTRHEQRALRTFVDQYSDPANMLPKYADLNSEDREGLIKQAEEYMRLAEEAENNNNYELAEEYESKAAEINSGIPAIEKAIEEYLEKYAIAIKIKTAHDTFRYKVEEMDMQNKFLVACSDSKDAYHKALSDLQEKQDDQAIKEKQQEFKKQVQKIKLDKQPIYKEKANITNAMNALINNEANEVELEVAKHYLANFSERIDKFVRNAEKTLNNSLNNGVRNTCRTIVNEYAEYINELDSNGAFRIGTYDVKKTVKFSSFNMNQAEDLLHDSKYSTIKKIKVGTEKVKESGFFSAIARILGIGGWKNVDKYVNKNTVYLKDLIQNQVTEMQINVNNSIDDAVSETESMIKDLKDETMKKLVGLDKYLNDLKAEIKKMIINSEELKRLVEENREKAEWLEQFIEKVDSLLSI